jgi:hypothetical protein
MTTFQTQLLNELAAGHDGPSIPESTRIYFQERFRGRLFEFLVDRFVVEQGNGLTKAKLARRIGKSPEVINRWLGAPSNLTADSISDLMLGICAEELEMDDSPLLNRVPVNYVHLAEFNLPAFQPQTTTGVLKITPKQPSATAST